MSEGRSTQDISTPRKILVVAMGAVMVGTYIALYPTLHPTDTKIEVIQNIHAYLDKNQDYRLDNTEAQPLEKQGVSLPGFTTVDELTTILQDKPLEDLQKILENLVK